MLTVPRPDFQAKETYLRCITSVRNVGLRSRLQAVAPQVGDAANTYASLAALGELHLVQQTKGVADIVSNQEMVDVYEYRMARQGSAGRSVYDALRALPGGGICPYCAHRVVSTLDHVLPKYLFAELAVTPDNLVGACKDCNHAKTDDAPTNAEDAPLHPYFDDISSRRWLHATVVEGTVAVVSFCVVAVDGWSDQLNRRIRHHFEQLGLATLYSLQAAREIAGQRVNMARIYSARGSGGVQEELRHQERSWEALCLNSWQAATFRALSRSEWYCAGAFGAA